MRGKGLAMRAMRVAMRAQSVTMCALHFIAKNVYMDAHNAQTNLVRIWSITYTNRRHR